MTHVFAQQSFNPGHSLAETQVAIVQVAVQTQEAILYPCQGVGRIPAAQATQEVGHPGKGREPSVEG